MGVEPSVRGWHKTALAGPLGAAAAAGVVMDLDADQLHTARLPRLRHRVGHQSLRDRRRRRHGEAHARGPRRGIRRAHGAARRARFHRRRRRARRALRTAGRGVERRPSPSCFVRPGQALGDRARLREDLSVLRVDPGGGAAARGASRTAAARAGEIGESRDRRLGVRRSAERQRRAARHDGRAVQHSVLRGARADRRSRPIPRCTRALRSTTPRGASSRGASRSSSIPRWKRRIRGTTARASSSSSRTANDAAARCSIRTACRPIRAPKPSCWTSFSASPRGSCRRRARAKSCAK